MSRNTFRRAQRLNRKELALGLLLFFVLVLLVLYGMYLGIWLLRKEEEHSNDVGRSRASANSAPGAGLFSSDDPMTRRPDDPIA